MVVDSFTVYSDRRGSGSAVKAAADPLISGWIYDATGSFSLAVVALIVLVLIMVVIQIVAAPKNEKQREKMLPDSAISLGFFEAQASSWGSSPNHCSHIYQTPEEASRLFLQQIQTN